MNDRDNPEEFEPQMNESEQSQVSPEQPAPASHFPREYILAVFIDMKDAKEAADSLRRRVNCFHNSKVYASRSPDESTGDLLILQQRKLAQTRGNLPVSLDLARG